MEGHARPEQLDVPVDLLDGEGVGPECLRSGRCVTAHPCAGDVGHHPVGTDEVGVEGDHVAVPDDRTAALLEPRVRPVARSQQATLHPLAVAGQHLGPEHAPDLVLAHAGCHGLEHLPAGCAGALQRAPHGGDLIGSLDLAGLLHDPGALHEADSPVLQGGDAQGRRGVEGEASTAATVYGQEVDDLGGEAPGMFVGPAAGQEVGERPGGANLVDEGVVGGEELAAGVVEQDQATVGSHERVPGLVVEQPDLHVRGVGGVHDVHRIEEEDPVEVVGGQLGDDAVQSVAHHRRLVG